MKAILEAFTSDPSYEPHFQAMLPALLPLVEQMSPDTYGGAVLLGVDGVCVISHGSSNATAMLNGIKVAQEMVERGVVAELRAAIGAAIPSDTTTAD
jgi:glycerol-3-phosphate acyltransferase PlsX